jgi:hypothetical protein
VTPHSFQFATTTATTTARNDDDNNDDAKVVHPWWMQTSPTIIVVSTADMYTFQHTQQQERRFLSAKTRSGTVVVDC